MEQELQAAVVAKQKAWHDLQESASLTREAERQALTELKQAKQALSDFIAEGALLTPEGVKPFGFLKRRAYSHEGVDFPPIYCIMPLSGNIIVSAVGPTPAEAVAKWNDFIKIISNSK